MTLQNLVFLFIFVGLYVSCGGKELYPTCSDCKSGGVTSSDVSCNGTCGLDDETSRCIEKGNKV